MNRLALLASLVVLLCDASAAARECHSSKPRGDHHWWSWRLVDGHRCWYSGHQHVAKTALTWHSFRAPPLETRVGKDAWKGSAPLTRHADGEGHPTISVPNPPTVPQPTPRPVLLAPMPTFEDRWPK